MMLQDLATEIIQLIVQNLSVRSDLNAFCQTNKRFHHIANDLVYHRDAHWRCNALQWGSEEGLVPVVERSLDQGADVNCIINHKDETALFPAVRKQHWDTVHLLLARGADVHRRNKVGDNLVYFAVTTGSYDLVKLMLDQGVDPNSHVEGDVPPLLLAVRRGYLDIVRLLFDSGAYIDDSDDWGETPLHVAVGASQHDILSFFIEKDVFRKDETGTRGADALEMAVIRGDMPTLTLLLEGGANPLIRRWTRHHAIITAALAREDDMAILMTERLVVGPGFLDEHGKELFWYAVKGRCQRYTRYLLDKGLDPDRDLWKEVDGSMVGGSALVVEMLGAGVLTA
ncbi:ankyrin protein [Fusarium denticulatum]|uniref:Ankyrin protein n=1 Tax=Fusarium denticulatum TaxID=48507 RepID=A0A8H5X4T1_9HYPO|nr:ankyrin protein [Fusarium denticulatum]